MTDEEGVANVLAERPDLESPLEAVLAVDEEHETWTFDDVQIESGPFGELVGRDVVESAGEEYRLADPDAVRTALAADETSARPDRDSTTAISTPALSLPSIDRTTALIVAAAVAFVGLIRVHPIDAIYREGAVVLSGNDPYYYRYWVERAMSEPGLPEGIQGGEPLLVATLAWLSGVLGGTADSVGHVLAWYPVVAAVIGAVFVYLLAVRVTGDRRIGVAAVLFLALIPGHALRTSVGYADHHAFDYVWLGATAVAVTWLADVDRANLGMPRTWALVVATGVAVATQVLAWDAGPLLVAPLGLVVAGRAAVDVRRGDSPVPAGLPVVAGLALGAALALAGHLALGYQSAAVALAPVAVAAGSAGVLAIATVVRRREWGVRALVAGYAVAGVATLVLLVLVLTPVSTVLFERLGTLFRSDAIAETDSLFDPESAGFLLLFGFALVLALPAMVVGLRRSVDDGRWLVLSTYGWYFLALAIVQVRFVGELATFAAVFAGYGFVWVAAWIDAVSLGDGRPDSLRPLRVPNQRVLATLFVLLLLFGSFGALQVGVKTSQVTIEDDVYESATYVADHAAERGQAYPENYVLSDWGRNRVYNYFVSGESSSYGYARANYAEFGGGTDPDAWYDQFDGRVGYVVLDRTVDGIESPTTIWQLGRHYGSATDETAGVGHYRTLYVPPGESRVVLEVVPGATLRGAAPADTDVSVATTVDASHASVEYERGAVANESGEWSVRVANPGTYQIAVGNESHTVDVPEEAVRRGEQLRVE